MGGHCADDDDEYGDAQDDDITEMNDDYANDNDSCTDNNAATSFIDVTDDRPETEASRDAAVATASMSDCCVGHDLPRHYHYRGHGGMFSLALSSRTLRSCHQMS